MGFFTAAKPAITEDELIRMMNEVHNGRDTNGNHLFNSEHEKYIRDEFASHLDPDAPGQYPGINQDEAAQVLGEMKKPNPLEQDKQRRFGIKHGFNDDQVNFLAKVEDKYLKR